MDKNRAENFVSKQENVLVETMMILMNERLNPIMGGIRAQIHYIIQPARIGVEEAILNHIHRTRLY
mgnify:CR=1 FL=1